ncbi:MAG: flagellar biosynthetic protein FliR [Nitrospirae bacterium]|nr:flagellar biosynthetic protein FliR [Nitrospirota bacterium]
MDLITVDLSQVERFALVVFRISGIMFVAPILGARNLPLLAKTGLSLVLSFLIFPTVDPESIRPLGGPIDLLLGLGSELLVGVTVGMVIEFFFASVEMAGEWLGVQIGFGMANILDPQGERQITILAQVKILIAFMLFLLVDGHHMIIRTVAKSFTLVPLMSAHFSGRIISYLFSLAGDLFVLGVKLAAPVMGILLMVEVAMALVARTVPQMNILMVGIPVKLMMGVIALGAMIPVVSFMILKNMPSIERNLAMAFRLMGQ